MWLIRFSHSISLYAALGLHSKYKELKSCRHEKWITPVNDTWFSILGKVVGYDHLFGSTFIEDVHVSFYVGICIFGEGA